MRNVLANFFERWQDPAVGCSVPKPSARYAPMSRILRGEVARGPVSRRYSAVYCNATHTCNCFLAAGEMYNSCNLGVSSTTTVMRSLFETCAPFYGGQRGLEACGCTKPICIRFKNAKR